MILYRPVGEAELRRIVESGCTAFPPRLPEQPIFYPVLDRRYAAEIAQRWNTRDRQSGFRGYVTQFEVEDRFLERYPVRTVGRAYHRELWVPAEELADFNRHIRGTIQVIETFEPEALWQTESS